MKRIILSVSMIFSVFLINAQSSKVSGTIKDADNGEALIGASILEKGTTNGTITDIDGNYQFEVENTDALLVVSYIGYKSREIPLNNRTTVNIDLELNLEELEEVVVVGYGTVRKSDLTGAVSSVKSEDMLKVPNASPVQALQGKVSGLQ
ncbi:MAG: carboxypeptidase-like regulatory domain-containing protein, partial [Marinoscillum sp.]